MATTEETQAMDDRTAAPLTAEQITEGGLVYYHCSVCGQDMSEADTDAMDEQQYCGYCHAIVEERCTTENDALRDRLARAEGALEHIGMVADSVWVDCVTGAADVADPIPMKADAIIKCVRAALATPTDG